MYWSSLLATNLSSKAIILMAKSAAFFEPELPMAKVATGTPDGICTVDKRLCNPDNLLSIGIPNTGTVVCAAVTPARCAAPPAAAKITFIPLFLAFVENVQYMDCVKIGVLVGSFLSAVVGYFILLIVTKKK